MNIEKKSKHILILGGMGPQASIYAHSLLIQAATKNGATNNEDYPRVTHLSINVKDFISTPANKQQALAYLIDCLREVDVSRVDSAIIACNTAHVLLDDLSSATGLQFTSLIDTTLEYIQSSKKMDIVGILATPSTIKSEIYSQDLNKVVRVINPSPETSRSVEEIIRDVISGKEESKLVAQLQAKVQELVDQGGQKVILGCTELSLLGEHLDESLVIDPLKLTVEKVLRHDKL
jgi:aspartate racemase